MRNGLILRNVARCSASLQNLIMLEHWMNECSFDTLYTSYWGLVDGIYLYVEFIENRQYTSISCTVKSVVSEN